MSNITLSDVRKAGVLTSETGGRPAGYDPLLTAAAIAYLGDPNGFIAGRMAPIINVELASAKYPVYAKGSFLTDEVGPRPMGGRFPMAKSFTSSLDSYQCIEEGLEASIDRRERANNILPFAPERARTLQLTNAHRIHMDRLIADRFLKTGVWSTDLVGVAAAPTASQRIFFNLSTSDPLFVLLTDGQAMKKATGYRPNSLILGADMMLALVNNSTVTSRVNGGATTGQPALVTLTAIAQWFALFGMPLDVIVADAVMNTAADTVAGTATMDWIVPSKSALLYYRTPTQAPDITDPSAFNIYSWTGLLGGDAFPTGGNARVSTRIVEQDTTILTVEMAYDLKVVAPDLGTFYSNIVQ